MSISISFATVDDVSAVTLLRCNVAKHLTDQYGRGHWSSNVTEKSVLRSIKTSRVIIAKVGTEVIGSLRLATKKPWAIDLKYFVTVNRPLYLHDLAVASGFRNLGVGRHLLEEAMSVAKSWPADAIRLDAYDAEAGAGDFYKKCGFKEVGRVKYRNVPLIYFERVFS